MSVAMELLGPRAWLDEARHQRARRIVQRARLEHAERARRDGERLRRLVFEGQGCHGIRAEHCYDCAWSDGEQCEVDLRPLGEWGGRP